MKAGAFMTFTSILGVAAADLAITWSDCGAKHAKTTDVQPSSLPLGSETAITGTGTLDEDVTGGTYDMELKAGGGLIDSHFTGNNCEAKSFDLPLGLGKLSWDGIACPLKAGTAKIGFHVTLASALPPALATSDITLNAGDQNSESLLCVQLHLASSVESTAGACSSDDQAALSDPNVIGKKAGDCGKTAYSIITGKFDHGKFNDCLTTSAGISAGCSECYAVSGDYGAGNCKAACLLGWCKSGCLDCVKPAQADLDTCTGFTSGSATPCMQSTAASCTSDDQSVVQAMDDNDFGDLSNKCGTKNYNIITGKLNEDGFKTCLVAGVAMSDSCADCYVATAEYGASNCKAACLLGWCKQGCLDCTASAQATLATCTGFPAGSPKPCLKSTAASCTSDDQSVVQAMDDNDFGDLSNKCGTKNYNIITGKLNEDGFKTCLVAGVAMSDSCADCYVATAEYGASNCKAACLLGWCKQGCLDCTASAQATLATCTGFPAGSPKPCLKSTAGSCSADDQSKLSDGATVGKAGSDCGLAAYNIITGAFNHDKFNSCFTDKLTIASGCSECYATNGEFAAKNCKAACLLGWCKQGCLDCSTAAAPKSALDACTGFTSGSADPCMEDIAV